MDTHTALDIIERLATEKPKRVLWRVMKPLRGWPGEPTLMPGDLLELRGFKSRTRAGQQIMLYQFRVHACTHLPAGYCLRIKNATVKRFLRPVEVEE